MASVEKDEARLAVELARGTSIPAAAEACSLSQRTIFRRKADPAFQRDVQRARELLIERIADDVGASMLEAVNVLKELQGEDQKAEVRLKASSEMLKFGLKLRDSLEIERRLRKLEGEVDGSPN